MTGKIDLSKLELKISYLLRFGVLLSAIFLGVGCINLFTNVGALHALSEYRPQSLLETIEIAKAEGNYFHLASLFGLSLLVALPLVRVALTAYLFLRNREFVLMAMALFVSLVLCFSFFLGIEL